MDLRDLIEREIEQYLEWPTADKSHVTTVSAKLFAEHVARLYADHIPDAGKMIEPAAQGEPVAYISHTSEGDVLGWERQFDAPSHAPLYAAPQTAEQQPDVTQLVEALEMARDRLESERRSGELDPLIRDIDDALAAHRKGGEV